MKEQKTNLVILGSTGSIGTQTLEVVRRFPHHFSVLALAEGHNEKMLLEQIAEFRPRYVYSPRPQTAERPDFLDLTAMASLEEADIVVLAMSGASGLIPAFAAAKAGKRIALANKETIVTAGYPFMQLCQQHSAAILPVDSEHSAIWQCLRGEEPAKRLIITASGGPFRQTSVEKLENVTGADALNHPSWVMGPKITIDSATLMNKGLEVIEAHHLFSLPFEQIEVLIHPQSLVHSMVEWPDGVIKAQMSRPSMLYPIQYALFHPWRPANPDLTALDLASVGRLDFYRPDYEKFPCLNLAIQAGIAGGTKPAILCAADEEAVSLFLAGKIKFTDIPKIIKECLDILPRREQTLSEVRQADSQTRQLVSKILPKYAVG